MITQNFFICFSIGFIASLQLGQASFYIFQKSMERGFLIGLVAVAGFFFAEVGYLFLSLTGTATVLQTFIPEIYLWFFGGVTLLYAVYQGFRPNAFPPEISQKQKLDGSVFITGFLLTAIHPINLLWWVGVLAPIMIADMAKYSLLIAVFDGSGVLFGELLVLVAVVFSASRLRVSVSQINAKKITRFSGICLLVTAIWFFYKAYLLV